MSKTSGELHQLSEKDLTRVAFVANGKNLIYFGVSAGIVYFVIAVFETIGAVLGWIAIAAFIVFALEPLFSLFLTTGSLFAVTPDKRWKLVQLLISGVTASIYIIFALFIYFAMRA